MTPIRDLAATHEPVTAVATGQQLYELFQAEPVLRTVLRRALEHAFDRTECLEKALNRGVKKGCAHVSGR